MPSTFNNSVFEKIVAGYAKRIDAATVHLQTKVRENVAKPFPPASSPGQYSHKRTGEMQAGYQRSVSVGAERIVGRVYNTVKHAAYNEFGTIKMAARPNLRRTLNENRSVILGIVRGESAKGEA